MNYLVVSTHATSSNITRIIKIQIIGRGIEASFHRSRKPVDIEDSKPIHRLLKKGVVTAERDGKRYLYSPRLKRADYVHSESKTLLDRLFDGRVAPLVAHFSERRKLSKKDLAELKRLIEELDHDDA